MRKEISFLLNKAIKKLKVKFNPEEIFLDIGISSQTSKGDYLYPCFKLGETLKLSPHLAALQLRAKIGSFSPILFDDISVQDEYICFYVDRKKNVQKLFWEVLNKREKFGETKKGKNILGFKKKICILNFYNFEQEYSFNNFYFDTICNSFEKILEKNSYKTSKFQIFNDFDMELIETLISYEIYGSPTALENNTLKHFFDCRKKLTKTKRTPILINEFLTRLCEEEKSAMLLLKIFKDAYFNSINKVKKDFNFSPLLNHDYIKILKFSKLYLSRIENHLITHNGLKGILLKDKRFYPLISKQGFYLKEFLLLFYLIFYLKKYKFNKIYLLIDNNYSGLIEKTIEVLELIDPPLKEKLTPIILNKSSIQTNKKDLNSLNFEEIFTLVTKGFEKLKTTKILTKRIIKSKEFVLNSLKTEIFKKNINQNESAINLSNSLKKGESFLGIFGSYYYATKFLEKSKLNSQNFEIEEIDDKTWELLKLLYNFPSFVKKSLNKKDPSLLLKYCFEITSNFNSFCTNKKNEFNKNPNFYFGIIEIYRQILRNCFNLLKIELAKLN